MNFEFLVICLMICCILFGFVLGYMANWFYNKWCKEVEEECDDVECEDDEE